MMNFKTILSGLTLFASLVCSAYEWEFLSNTTAPGTVLESGFYQVNGIVKISAADEPGVSALRVAPGAMVAINIPFGSTLTVVGGNAEGLIGAGAGIEVPADSKLLICGAGLLYAQGGNAASGSTGRAGEDGEMTAFFNVKLEDAENIDEDDLPDPLLCMITGAGGDGGNGGGGAGAAIGGRGGRGGLGGKGGVARPIVDIDVWNGVDKDKGTPNNEVYQKWLTLLGHDLNDLYVYNQYNYELGTDGRDGEKGGDGKAGGSCGDIVIGEYVQVVAIPGMPGVAGAGGPHGKAANGPELDISKLVRKVIFEAGLEIVTAIFSDDEEDDEEEEDDEDAGREEILRAFGGGGGGGGAGGAGAPQGIGPGGAGGAGGGGAGSGLFAYGANAREEEVEMNGGGGHGGEGVYVMTIEGEDGEEDTVITTNGEDGEESDPINFYDEDFEEDEVMYFNVFTNDLSDVVWEDSVWEGLVSEENLNRLCATSLQFYDDDIYDYYEPVLYWSGKGGAGGKSGKELTLGTRKFRVSENATVLAGLEEENQEPFEGEVIVKLTLGDQTTEVICGQLVTPVPVPESHEGFFMGYFTETDGRGEQYYDYLGQPVGHQEIWNAMTLYPHFVGEKPADVHKIEFRYFENEEDSTGELVASIWVREGRNLPMVGTKTLDKIRGWRVIGAYLPGATEEELDWWYDEDGLPIKEGEGDEAYEYDRTGDLVLHVLLAPKWEKIAEMPKDGVHFVYTGKGFSGVDLESETYEVVKGSTTVATNVGDYTTTIRLKEGYEIWDDFLENPVTATNEERTINWTIDRADLDRLTLPNRVYDWAKPNSTFEVEGKIPDGVTVRYETMKYLGNGTVEIKAIVDGGENYRSKEMVATWSFPELLRIENVVSHYPWDTKVQLDVAANPLYSQDVYTNRPDAVIIPVTEDGHKFTSASFTVKEAISDKGTIVLDLKDALAKGRKVVSIYLTINDFPCSCEVRIAADTTAEMVKEGRYETPTYKITDPAQVLPITQSWRIAAEEVYTEEAETTLEIMKDGEVALKEFEPVNRVGRRVNDDVVGWVPQENGRYTLMLRVYEGRSTAVYSAYFKVDYPEGTSLPIVAYVGETGYSTLAEAVEAAKELSGEERAIRIVGDVQTEEVQLPDGEEAITIVYDRGGVFDATRQFEAPENQLPNFNDIFALTGYTLEEGADVVSPDCPPEAPIRVTEDFRPLQIVENFKDGGRALMEVCADCNAVRVILESAGTFDGAALQVVEFALVGNELKGKVMLRDVKGDLKPLTGKLILPLKATNDLKKGFETSGNLELQDGEFTIPYLPDQPQRFYKIQ